LCISRSTSLDALGEYLLAMRMLQIGIRVDDHGKSALGHGPSGEMHNQRNQEEDEEDIEQNLGDAACCTSYAAEAESARYESDNKKD